MIDRIFTDAPLQTPESDRLGYAPFAKKIADMICKASLDEGLVMSLYASWGTGKTSCLNFIRYYINEVDESDRPLCMLFNPWWISGEGDLLRLFFNELLTVLGKQEKFKGLRNKVATFGEVISSIPEPTGLGKVFGKGAELLKAREKQLWELKEEISREIKKQNCKILIIIDDIDRLSTEEIRNTFKVVKAVADFPNTIYLLSFDKSVVVNALEKVQNISGEVYLEKIVQVPFDLPMLNRTAIRKLFFETLDTIFIEDDTSFDQTYFENVFWDGIDHFINTIRNLKRLTNALRVTYSSVKGEVNPVDFLAIETIRVFLPDIYNVIKNNQEMYAGNSSSDSYSGTIKKDLEAFHKGVIETVQEKAREHVKSLLIRIFPKVKTAFENNHYGYDWESEWRKKLRVCSPSIFPTYFCFSIQDGQISNTQMKFILSIAGDSEKFESKLLELSQNRCLDNSTLLSVFLERMQDYTDKDIPIHHIDSILNALFNVGDILLDPGDDKGGLIGYGNDIRIGRIMFQLLKRYETKDQRFASLKSAFSKGQALCMIVSQVAILGQQHGKYGSNSKPEENQLIDESHLLELEKLAVAKIKEFAAGNELLKVPNLIGILYRWRDWENEDAPKKWILESRVLTDDETLVDLLTDFLRKSHVQSMDDRVARVVWKLKPKDIEPFMEPQIIVIRCKEILAKNPEWLKDAKLIAVKTLIREYENPSDDFYDRDDD